MCTRAFYILSYYHSKVQECFIAQNKA